MKTLVAVLLSGGFILVAPAVHAEDASALMQKGGCIACHSVDKKILGPAYKDVAAKYKGQKDAEALLIKKVKEGGSGVWGPIPMSSNAGKLSDDEFKRVVEWILSL
ncbi:MAG: c-type cytochrome [Methylobacillus sp.]|jgi:cytochrome c|nr:c-type cytochrome [Methylobacillus sp.]